LVVVPELLKATFPHHRPAAIGGQDRGGEVVGREIEEGLLFGEKRHRAIGEAEDEGVARRVAAGMHAAAGIVGGGELKLGRLEFGHVVAGFTSSVYDFRAIALIDLGQ
jgi:hypothetical protein